MLLVLILIYAVSLVYFSVTERFRTYAMLVGLQGWVLLFLALMQLQGASWGEFLFVLAETLIFKGLIVPYMLFNIIRKTGINKVHRGSASMFKLVLFSVAALIVSMVITSYIADSNVNQLFFGVSLYGLLSGMMLITTHKRIFSQLVGFLVVENAVLLFSFTVGVEMPFLINIAILLDILLSVLMLGMFISRIGMRLPSMDSEELTRIKD